MLCWCKWGFRGSLGNVVMCYCYSQVADRAVKKKKPNKHANTILPSSGTERRFIAAIPRSPILPARLLIAGSSSVVASECFSHRWSDPNEPE